MDLVCSKYLLPRPKSPEARGVHMIRWRDVLEATGTAEDFHEAHPDGDSVSRVLMM